MRLPKSLASRLALLYVVALVAGLVVFALFALVTIDRVQRASTDATLVNEATAAATLVLPESDSGGLDAEDINAFRHVLGAHANGALFDARGRLEFSTVTDLPEAIGAPGASGTATARDVDIDGAHTHAVAASIARGLQRSGTVVLWRRSTISPTSTAARRSASWLQSRSSRLPHSSLDAVSRIARCSLCGRLPN